MVSTRFALSIFVFIMSSVHAVADWSPDQIRFSIASNHVNNSNSHNLNEHNPGISLTWKGRWLDVNTGMFRNSFEDNAPFVFISRDIWSTTTCSTAGFMGTAHYPSISNEAPYQINKWIPMGGLEFECGPYFVQAMPGRGLFSDASGKGVSDAILVFGFVFDL